MKQLQLKVFIFFIFILFFWNCFYFKKFLLLGSATELLKTAIVSFSDFGGKNNETADDDDDEWVLFVLKRRLKEFFKKIVKQNSFDAFGGLNDVDDETKIDDNDNDDDSDDGMLFIFANFKQYLIKFVIFINFS